VASSIRDDRGRELLFARPPKRVVSLVPSDTFTIAKLLGDDAIVGRTDYCQLPDGITRAPSVGGTKNASIEKILDLRPEVVIANQEENSRGTLEAVAQAGVAVFVVFPKRVEDGIALIARYARLFGVERAPHVRDLVRAAHRALEAQRRARAEIVPLRAFCPIWMDPLMTIHGATYISDALDLAGAQNVFADRERRYPLAADLGTRAPLPKEQIEGRDLRYPRVTLDEVAARAPEVVLLPDEPHPFTKDDAEVFRALDLPEKGLPEKGLPEKGLPKNGLPARGDRVVFLNGKDVCWYGAWAIEGIPRLAATIAGLGRDQAR
jgi:ABC-type Fe3+-hydroxamate transport system substrate-binding protein